jgi:hypothetical protein
MYSSEMAGRSTSWIWMLMNCIMPAIGRRVVKGYSPTSGWALVRDRSRADLPVFGGPTRTTWPAPSRSTEMEKPPRRRRACSASPRSLAKRRLRSPWRCSVPLCLGMRDSISSSTAIFSSSVLAALKRLSASRYCGVRLAGMAPHATRWASRAPEASAKVAPVQKFSASLGNPEPFQVSATGQGEWIEGFPPD